MQPISSAQGRAIDLPWPSKALNPNSRPHWARKASAIKIARYAAGWACKEAGIRKIEAEALKVTAIFSPPDNRARDTDNMLSSIKAYLDGIADVVDIDDSKFRIELVRGVPCPGGNVRIILEPVDTWEQIGGPASRVIGAIPAPRRGAA